jgi:hypothetical protein
MKQETLEEAAENYNDKFQENAGSKAPHIKNQHIMNHFIAGANYQAERMYSEEDMIRFAEFVATHHDKNKNVYGEMLHAKSKYDDSERTVDLLEQFKKK